MLLTIFALDASGKTAGACVMRGGELLFERTLNEGLTHSETLLPLADAAFRESGLTPAGVNLYAVTAGPGSFTGLRIGMALVKGLALPCNTAAAPVSTLEALALGSDLEGFVVTALNARRGEVYWAAFEMRDGACKRLVEDSAGPAAGMARQFDFTRRPLYIIGDGAEICYTMDEYSELARPAIMPQVSIARGAALAAARMLRQGQALPASEIQPRYLRLSQAERERAEKLKQSGI